jgi:hypothetical protein
MVSFGMLRHVALVRTDILALSSSKTSVLIKATWRNIPEDGILHSYCRENLKSYIKLNFSDQIQLMSEKQFSYQNSLAMKMWSYLNLSCKCKTLVLHIPQTLLCDVRRKWCIGI